MTQFVEKIQKISFHTFVLKLQLPLELPQPVDTKLSRDNENT